MVSSKGKAFSIFLAPSIEVSSGEEQNEKEEEEEEEKKKKEKNVKGTDAPVLVKKLFDKEDRRFWYLAL